MVQKSRRYSAAFKANAMRLAKEPDKSIADVARELGVPYGTLYNWMWKVGAVGQSGEARGRATMSPSEAELQLRRVQRELDDLKMENDFLKKWAAFSTKRTSN